MAENSKGQEIVQINLTRVHLVLATIMLFITLATPIITGFITISKNTEAIGRHDVRLQTLEHERTDNHDLLMELKFNLKAHMESAGEKYIGNEATLEHDHVK